MSDANSEAAPEAAAATAKEPAKGGSKKKLLIIIASAVVAFGGAGGGAFFFMKGDSHEASADSGEDEEEHEGEEAEEEPKEDAKKDAKSKSKSKTKGKKGKEPAPKAPAIYVKFEPPFVVNFEAKGVMRFLQVTIEVMTRDQQTAELVKLHDPKLRNDLLFLLGSQTYETISTLEGKEGLRKHALETIAKVVGDEGGKAKEVEDLYFTSFVMQ
jgi:flagellar protein FliL